MLKFNSFFCLFLCFLLRTAGATAQTSDYYPFEIDEDAVAGVADFSRLNHALGEADRIFVKNAHFYRTGKDGKANTADDSRIRLFGISLANGANFPSEADAPRIARRLRRLGFNAVRLHHLDSILSDDLDKPRGILSSGAFPSFNSTAMARLKFFIQALKAEGIYVDLNLHVGYNFRPAVDGVTPLAPGESMPHASHPLHLFEPKMISLQAQYARELIRGLGLNNDPVLALIEINNESSMLGAWQHGDLDDLKGEYERLLLVQWQRWIVRRYGSLQAACAQWASCSEEKQGGLLVKSAESSVFDSAYNWLAKSRHMLRRGIEKLGLESPAVLGHSFEVHPQGAGKRVQDYVAFLLEMDKNYLETMRKAVRAEVGDLVALTGSQMYYGGIANADAQQNMDYVDEHFYVDHYDFPRQSWDRNDWRIRDSSLLRDSWMPLLQRTFYRDLSKPYVLSEFNEAYPNRQGAEILPVMAAFASAQDWDGLFFYHYIDGDSWKSLPDSFTLSGDWEKWVGTGMAAAIFRQFQVAPFATQISFAMTPEVRQLLAALRDDSAYYKFLQTVYGLDVRQAMLHRIGVQQQMQAGAASQTGKMEKLEEQVPWQAQGSAMAYFSDMPHLRVDADFAWLYAGTAEPVDNHYTPPAGRKFELKLATERRFAVMLASSRDGQKMNVSRRVLLSLVGAAAGSQPDAMPPRPKKLVAYEGQADWWTLEPDSNSSTKPSGPRDATGPMWLERVEAQLFYPTHYKKLTIYALDGKGGRKAAVPARYVHAVEGGYLIQLNKLELGGTAYISPWYELLLE